MTSLYFNYQNSFRDCFYSCYKGYCSEPLVCVKGVKLEQEKIFVEDSGSCSKETSSGKSPKGRVII